MESKHKNALIGALLAVVFVMAVGYAAFATTLTINGTATINSSWNVHFDTSKTTTAPGVVTPTTGTGGTDAPVGTVGYDGNLTANVNATLNQPGDKVEFLLTILNEGSLPATLAAPSVSGTGTTTCTGNVCTSQAGHIQFTVENPASNSLVANNGNTTIKVTAEFKNENVTSLAGEESAGITVTIVASQAQ